MADMRWNAISGKWTLIATGRRSRPKKHSIFPATPKVTDPGCPFCPGNEDQTPPTVDSFPTEGPDWQIRVVSNKYPAIPPDPLSKEKSNETFESKSGGGRHEVIIDSADHLKGLADHTESHVTEVLMMLQRRVCAMSQFDSIQFVAPFKNHGAISGASLEHSHLQVIGMPVVPPHVGTERMIAEKHFAKTGQPILENVIQEELKEGDRIIETKNDGVVTYCPFASQFPFQVEISPWPTQESFASASRNTISIVGGALRRALWRIKTLLNDPPLNLFFNIETLTKHSDNEAAHRWRIQITPRLTVLAGLEIGAGMHINEMAPEEAAETLREINF
jgi:UDPglucose--hexose-1-phosphate uridylyltransferase